MARGKVSKKIAKFNPKDVKHNFEDGYYCEIPVFNNVVLDYFATKAEYLEDSLRDEIQLFVEQNCQPEGIETYEDIANELYNQVTQNKNGLEEWDHYSGLPNPKAYE